MVAGLVSSCLRLMSRDAKSSVDGSLSNHGLQLVCVCLVLLACHTSKLPTVWQSLKLWSKRCLTYGSTQSGFHLSVRKCEYRVYKNHQTFGRLRTKSDLNLNGKAKGNPVAHVNTPAGN